MMLAPHPSLDQVLAGKTLWWTRLAFWTCLLTLFVAVIAAVPAIKNWVPVKLSKTEIAILRMAVKGGRGSEYFGVLWHFRGMSLSPNARGVGVPYGDPERLPVQDELIQLCGKGLLHLVTDSPQGDGRAVEYRLTDKGIKRAKALGPAGPVLE